MCTLLSLLSKLVHGCSQLSQKEHRLSGKRSLVLDPNYATYDPGKLLLNLSELVFLIKGILMIFCQARVKLSWVKKCKDIYTFLMPNKIVIIIVCLGWEWHNVCCIITTIFKRWALKIVDNCTLVYRRLWEVLLYRELFNSAYPIIPSIYLNMEHTSILCREQSQTNFLFPCLSHMTVTGQTQSKTQNNKTSKNAPTLHPLLILCSAHILQKAINMYIYT